MSALVFTARRIDNVLAVVHDHGRRVSVEFTATFDESDQRRTLAALLAAVPGEIFYTWLTELAPDFVAEIRGGVPQ